MAVGPCRVLRSLLRPLVELGRQALPGRPCGIAVMGEKVSLDGGKLGDGCSGVSSRISLLTPGAASRGGRSLHALPHGQLARAAGDPDSSESGTAAGSTTEPCGLLVGGAREEGSLGVRCRQGPPWRSMTPLAGGEEKAKESGEGSTNSGLDEASWKDAG